MKGSTKCLLYFSAVPILIILTLVNYLWTHNTDGFDRLKSLNLDVQKFYCYVEMHQYERCKELAKENQLGERTPEGCSKFRSQLDHCNGAIKSKENDIVDACW
jgi:hypothetical protein